ncbi:hypothetical protein EVAR_87426_1 [Eumeta japonica]|uniref:Uncharacterized protein n=1 Tax=Eumeta variegata TaxID=151549 RepID=A0A4C1XKK8_EUMVA|nr:hypothetical protein EVAR_87426_1 [Eumeta japonica]
MRRTRMHFSTSVILQRADPVTSTRFPWRDLGSDHRPGRRKLEESKPALPPAYQSRSSEVPNHRSLGSPSLRCQSPSGGDSQAEQFIPNPQPLLHNYKSTTHKYKTVWRSSWTLRPPSLPGNLFITPAALHKIVMRLPKKKAPGPDSISTAALRYLPRRAIVAMNRVFNGILCTGQFSEA